MTEQPATKKDWLLFILLWLCFWGGLQLLFMLGDGGGREPVRIGPMSDEDYAEWRSSPQGRRLIESLPDSIVTPGPGQLVDDDPYFDDPAANYGYEEDPSWEPHEPAGRP